ncbi:MAG: N-acetylmuramoyl-L-alanine amidase family protein [Cellulosilyticaceae bacterium]
MCRYFLRWVALLCMMMSLTTVYAVGVAKEETKAKVICIDPGHQAKGDAKSEPIAPGASARKARVSSGTAGVGTKKAEYIINLEAATILKQMLENKGYQVVMTREIHEVNMSNSERAQVANKAGADMTVRIHCDSISNGEKTGASLLVPSKESSYTKAIYTPSYQYAECLKQSLVAKGVKVNGIFERADMTGFNWSKVPVIVFEMGFMSNWNEDQMLASRDYQTKLMEAVTVALDQYFSQKAGS